MECLDTTQYYVHHKATMDISLSYLETLSSADLISLADEYGIDIPDGLNRRFVIAELLDIIDDSLKKPADTNIMLLEQPDNEVFTLPKSYNETQIAALLRNPAWAFVYWDISDSDFHEIRQSRKFMTLMLRLSYFSSVEAEKPSDFFEIPMKLEDRDRYVLLTKVEYAVRVDLVVEFKNMESRVLARSKKLVIPKGGSVITTQTLTEDISPVLALSGLSQLRRTHYFNHRQSFS